MISVTSGAGGGSIVCNRWVYESYQPGDDGKLGTADDVLSGTRSVQEVSAGNVITRETALLGPGPDGAWDTADDVIGFDMRVVAAPGGAVFYGSFSAPGPDGQWETGDDIVSGASWAQLDDKGRPVETRSFQGPGSDMQWMTADDLVEQRYLITYGDGKTAPSSIALAFASPGPDQAWGTGDDPITGATRRYEDWGAFSSAAGKDGVWGTDDDELDGRYEDKRNWKGFLQWAPQYAAGPDGQFFTPDDFILGVGTVTCSDGVRDARFVTDPGADGAWGTADDGLKAHLRITGCVDICGAKTPTSVLDPPK